MNTTEQFRSLIDDVAYLTDEAQALIKVIDVVPAAEKRGGLESMLDMLYLIDHAQLTYYRPLIEQVFSLPEVKTEAADFRKTIDLSKQTYGSAASLLQGMIENRRKLVKYLEAAGHDSLLKSGQINGAERSIADLLQEMVAFERQQLKLVAERVMAIDRSKQPQGKPGL